MEEQIPEILYHYCSVDTFVKIVQNKTLRLSEIAKSNDSMECQWVQKKVVPDLLINKLDRIIYEHRSLLFKTRPETIKHRLLDLYQRSFGGDKGILSMMVLAICFSERGDVLSQWRGYASDGTGVSIGFSTRPFTGMFKDKEDIIFNLKKVIYDVERQQSEVGGAVDQFLRTIDIDELLNGNIVINGTNEEPLIPLFNMMAKSVLCSVTMKNTAFEEESEWRLFVSFFWAGFYSKLESQFSLLKQRVPLNNLDVISKNDKMQFYTELDLGRLLPNASKLPNIIRVVLGPKCKLNNIDIELLLERYGWDISNLVIDRSKATYV